MRAVSSTAGARTHTVSSASATWQIAPPPRTSHFRSGTGLAAPRGMRRSLILIVALIAHRAVADDQTSAPDPTCGDGVVEGDEECDDGNTRVHDGCDASCHVEPLWG